MAFTKDLTENDGYAPPVDGLNKKFVMKRRVDFTVAANQLANAQTMGLFNVPAGVLVEETLMNVVTPDADITDVDIGSFTTAGVAVVADGFVDGATLAAAGVVRDLAGETYSRQDGTAGYSSTSNWKIGFTNNDAQTINEAVVDFFALCVDLR
jgi:hypothetical protein